MKSQSDDIVQIRPDLMIHPEEIRIVFSRSSGPGGQHVNKASTRVTILFDIGACSTLTETQKNKIQKNLKQYIDKYGRLQLHSQEYRSQSANRKTVMERFGSLLREALRPTKKRKKTRIPCYAVENRLQRKKQRAKIKQHRGQSPEE